jgi:hypothetical protein
MNKLINQKCKNFKIKLKMILYRERKQPLSELLLSGFTFCHFAKKSRLFTDEKLRTTCKSDRTSCCIF